MKKLFNVVSLVLMLSMLLTTSVFADGLTVDGDIVESSPNVSVSDCTKVNTFDGSAKIKYQGSKHFESGAALTVTVVPDTGITATGPSINPTLTNPWNTNNQEFTFAGITTTVPIGVLSGTYKVTVTVSGAQAGGGTHEVSDFFNVNVNCTATPSNTPPVINADYANVTVNEGQTAMNTGTWSDLDATDTVELSASVGSVIKYGTNAAGTWSWSFVTADGPAQSQTVTITANDGQGGVTTTTFALTVNNVAPTVATPAWSTATVACRSEATLTNISFSDPGVIDYPWTVVIKDDLDNSLANYPTNTQGVQQDVTYTYNTPGFYTATVTVTDKDSGEGSASTMTSLQVLQVYEVEFLRPFDGSSPESGLVVNQMKNGRVVPVKVKIFDVCTQEYVTDPDALVTIKVSLTNGTGNGTTDTIEEYADAGASSGNTNQFRWTEDGFWIYNLDSKALRLTVGKFYRIDVYVADVKATTTTWGVINPVK